MPFIISCENESHYRCCFREIHSKVGVFLIIILNSFAFTMLLVQTALSGQRSNLDISFLIIQSIVVVCTSIALITNSRVFLLASILFWLGVSSCVFILILFAIVYAIYPNDFPSRFNLIFNHKVLEELQQGTVQGDKLNMVRGVAITGIVMLFILFLVCLWFVEIHRKCYKYMRELVNGRIIPIRTKNRRYSDI